MPTQTISQSGFIRGLNASVDRIVQPKGSVPRMSNLLLTRRGGLVTCDGTALVFSPQGITNTFNAIGSFTNLSTGSVPFVTGIGRTTGRQGVTPTINVTATTYAGVGGVTATRVNPTSGVGGSVGITTYTTGGNHSLPGTGVVVNITGFADATFNGNFVVDTIPATNQFTVAQVGPSTSSTGGSVSTGGLNPATQYFYKVTAVDYPVDHGLLLTVGTISANQTLPSSEVFVTPGGANNAMRFTITTTATSAAGYLIYRSTSTGTEKLVSGYQPNTNPAGTLNFVDLGYTMAFPNISPPVANTTTTSTYYSMASTTANGLGNLYGSSSVVADLPNYKIQAIIVAPGAYDGNYASQSISNYWSPFGGWQGAICPIPTLVEFAGTQILVLGNGYPPMQYSGGTTITALSGGGGGGTPPPGAAAAVVYAGALWVANTAPYNLTSGLDGPSAIRRSDNNNPNSWTNTNAAFLGKDDGTQITGMAVFTIAESGIIPTGSLIVFKEYSTYQITSVLGATNVTIQQAQTAMGCIAPKTIQFVPGFGIVRLTHLGWAVFDGVRDKLLSEELRPYIFQDPAQQWLGVPNTNPQDIDALDWAYAYRCVGFQTSTPALYAACYPTLVNGNGTGTMFNGFAFDLVLKAWTQISWGNGTTILNDALIFRPISSLPVALLADSVGNIMRWQAGDETWTPNVLVNWSVTTPEVIGREPTDRLFLRRLLVRGKNLATVPANFTTPTVTPFLDGVGQFPAVSALVRNLPSAGNAGKGIQLDTGMAPGRIATSANCIVSGSGRVQIDSFDWTVSPRPAGRPVTIS